MNKPHTKIRKLAIEQNKSSTKYQKKILPVSQREGSNESLQTLMEPKQHIIK